VNRTVWGAGVRDRSTELYDPLCLFGDLTPQASGCMFAALPRSFVARLVSIGRPPKPPLFDRRGMR